jgi:hypothetical protein
MPSSPTKLLRGGSWDFSPWNCRSAYRSLVGPGLASSNVGFRLVAPAVQGQGLSWKALASSQFPIVAARIGHPVPTAYRLMRTRSGDYCLEGLFTWTEGWERGAEWRTIQTVTEDASDDEPYGRVIS